MSALATMIRRQAAESRWMLALTASALFGLGWLFVYVTHRIETQMREEGASAENMRRAAFLRGMGGPAMDFSSAAIEVMLWNHPLIIIMVSVWAIGRGSAAVAGEIERGTLDLTLSRPVSRPAYLAAQVAVAVLGLAVLAAALVAGNRVGGLYNTVETPPATAALARPALNLALIGLAIFGITLALSAADVVRWRPNLLASTATLAMFIAQVVANIPTLEEWKWLEKFSIFKAYNPVEAVIKGDSLPFNAVVLAGIGAAGIALAFVVFGRRDLPSNS